MKTQDFNTFLDSPSTESFNPYKEDTIHQRVKDLLSQLTSKQRLGFKGLIYLSLIACFLYINYLTTVSIALPALFILITSVELGSRLLAPEKPSIKLETGIFLTTSLLQALQLSLWGLHQDWGLVQLFCLHLSFICYLMARTGQISNKKLGLMAWSDFCYTAFLFPIKYFCVSFLGFFSKITNKTILTDEERHHKQAQLSMILISILVALGLVSFVASQLSQVLPAFGNLLKEFFTSLGQGLRVTINPEIAAPTLLRLLFSIPLALGLVAQLVATYLAKDKPLNQARLEAQLSHTRLFPKTASYIIIGSLCLVYSLFILTAMGQMGDLLSLNQANIPAYQASSLAVDGFWQLVRVSVLNFGVLAILYVFSKENLFNHKGLRLVVTLLFAFATLFALIAGWKLFGIYIAQYGLTSRRLLSGWFLLVLLVWCLLTLIRLNKPIQATRLGVFFAAISFTLVSLLASFVL